MAAELTIQSVEQMTSAVEGMSTAFDKLQKRISGLSGSGAVSQLKSIKGGVTELEATLKATQGDMLGMLAKLVIAIVDLPTEIADALADSARGFKAYRTANKTTLDGIVSDTKTASEAQAKALAKTYETQIKADATFRNAVKTSAETNYESQLRTDSLFRKAQNELAEASALAQIKTAESEAIAEAKVRESQLKVDATFRSAQEAYAVASAAAQAKTAEGEAIAEAKLREAQIKVDAVFRAAQEAQAAESSAAKLKVAAAEAAQEIKIRETQIRSDAIFRTAQVEAAVTGAAAQTATAEKAAIAEAKIRETQLKADATFRAAQLAMAEKEAAQEAALQASLAKARTGSIPVAASGGVTTLNEALSRTPQIAGEASKAVRAFGIDANDTHSAVRGLASGFNAMFLTWGNLLPLLAGAGVSNGFVQTIKLGSQVSSTFDTIRVLSEETVKSIGGLENQLVSLGKNGPFGPSEITQAMKTLSLAGLSAREVTMTIKDVLDFAIAGDTNLKTSADVLTSVAKEFGYAATQYNVVADVISKSAAISKSSVENMSEAFKSSTVLNKEFGISLEDVGVGLAALSNLGVTGTAAGTSLRNMYVDLTGRSKQAASAMKLLNLEVIDQSGKMPDLVTIIDKMSTALDNSTTKDRLKFEQMLTSERGLKSLIPLMDLYKTKTVDATGAASNALSDLSKSVKDNASFAANAAVELSLTANNEMKSVLATLQTSSLAAFKAIEPAIFTVSEKLKAMFNSPEFVSGVKSMVEAVTSLTVALVNMLPVIIKAAEVWLVWKASMLAFSGAKFGLDWILDKGALVTAALIETAQAGGTLGKALTALSIVTPTTTTAIGTLGVAVETTALSLSPMLTLLTGPVGLVALIAAAGAAFYYYATASDEASAASDRYSSRGKSLIEKLDLETQAIRDKIKALRESKTLEDVQSERETNTQQEQLTKALAKANIDLATATAAVSAAKELQNLDDGAGLSLAQSVRDKALQRVQDIKSETAAITERYKIRNAETAALAVENAAHVPKQVEIPNGEVSLPEKAAKEIASNMLALAEKTNASALASLKKSEADQTAVLENAYKNKLISQGTYTAQSLQLTAESEAAQLEAIKKGQTEQDKAYNVKAAEASKKYATDPVKLTEALRNIREARVAASQLTADKIEVIESTAEKRRTVAMQNAQGEYGKLKEASDTFWTKEAEHNKQVTAEQNLTDKLKNTTEVSKAATAAFEKTYDFYKSRLGDLSDQLRKTAKDLADFYAAMDPTLKNVKTTGLGFDAPAAGDFSLGSSLPSSVFVAPTVEQQAALDAYVKTIALLKDEYTKTTAAAKEQSAIQGDLAGIAKYLNSDLGESMAKGFGKAGSAMAGLVNAIKGLKSAQDEYNASLALANNLHDRTGDDATYAKQVADINTKAAKAQVNNYATMASAAAAFFKQGSTGYKVMTEAEKFFRGYQLLMSNKVTAEILTSLGKQLSAFLFGDKTKEASAVSSSSTIVAAKGSEANANALAGVSNQAGGDPYSAFFRMAAMAAVMAGMGLLVKGFGGGGAKTVDPGNTGTGTVFGAETAVGTTAAAQSKSIANSLDIIKNNTGVGINYSAAMLSALKSIDANISGLTNLVLRTDVGAAGAGVTEGKTGTHSWESTINNAIGKGLTIFGGSTLANIGTSILNKLTTLAFGTKTAITATGLYAGSQSLASVASSGVNLQNYADVNTSKKFFGITYSTKSDTKYQTADAELAKQFSLILTGFSDAVKAAAEPLGMNLDTVTNSLNNFVVNIGKIDLNGLTGDQINEKLQAVFSATGDQIAKAAIPGLDAFQKVGSGYLETLVRVAVGIDAAKVSLDNLGVSMIDYTTIVNKQGDVAVELIRQSLTATEKAGSGVANILSTFSGEYTDLISLYQALMKLRDGVNAVTATIGHSVIDLNATIINAAGGVSNLQSNLDTYFSEFLTASEQAAIMTQQVGKQFAALGETLPSSVAGYKSLLAGIDTSTEAGQKLFGQTIALASSFDALMKAIEATNTATDPAIAIANQRADLESKLVTAQDSYNKVAMTSVAYAALQRAAIDQSNLALYDQIIALNKSTAILQERATLQTQLDGLTQTSAEKLAAQRAALDESNRGLFDQIQAATAAADAYKAAAAITADLQKQLTTAQDEYNKVALTTAEYAALQRSAVDASNLAIYDQIQLTNKATAELNERNDLQKQLNDLTSTADQKLKAQRDAINDVNKALFDQVQAATAAAQAAQALQETWANLTTSILSEIDKLKGDQGTTSNSFATAQANFSIAAAQAKAGDQTAAGNLPALADALIASATANASSAADVTRIRAQTINTLQDVANTVASAQGLTVTALDAAANVVSVAANANAAAAAASAAAAAVAAAAAAAATVTVITVTPFGSASTTTVSDQAAIAAASAAAAVAANVAGTLPTQQVQGFALGGDFNGGWRVVGENGPELEATGPSRIYNAQQTRAIFADQQNARLAEEIRELKLLVAQLIADQRAGMGAIAANTGKVASIMRDVTQNRTSISTSPVA